MNKREMTKGITAHLRSLKFFNYIKAREIHMQIESAGVKKGGGYNVIAEKLHSGSRIMTEK